MRYSLLSRFQGTLLGAALGEVLGAHLGADLVTEGDGDRFVDQSDRIFADQTAVRSPLNLSNGQWAAVPYRLTAKGGGRAAIDYAEQFIQTRSSANLTPASSHTAPEIAIATIPIALFFHENRQQLNPKLEQTAALWSVNSEIKGSVLVMGNAIALALQEQLHPLSLIPKLVTELNLAAYSPLFTGQLQQVQICLDQQVGLTKTISLLSSNPAVASLSNSSDLSITADLTAFALAFYCFLSTPEDYSLSLLRSAYGAAQVAKLKTLMGLSNRQFTRLRIGITVLTGALSGAHTSLSGIPTDWRVKLGQAQDSPSAGLWSPSPVNRIDRLAAQFFAIWSGVAWLGNPKTGAAQLEGNGIAQLELPFDPLPIAAPNVIRPR